MGIGSFQPIPNLGTLGVFTLIYLVKLGIFGI